MRILLGASLLTHLALVMLLLLFPGRPAGQGEMSVELGTLVMPPQKIAVPPAPPAPAMPNRLAPQPAARPVPVNAGGQRDLAGHVPVPAPSSFAPGFLPAPGNSPRGMGAPAPLPFPEQQRRITIPYSTYSSSRRAAA